VDFGGVSERGKAICLKGRRSSRQRRDPVHLHQKSSKLKAQS